jgi:hypothetical protein
VSNSEAESSVRRDSLVGTVGWDLWNYSKRVTSARNVATTAREHLESCRHTNYWTQQELAELERLTVLLETCARRAEMTWDKLRTAQNEKDSDFVTDDGGIAVIQGGGRRPELQERLTAIYRAGDVTEYWDIVVEFKLLMVDVERRQNRLRGKAISAAIKQRRLTDNLMWHETLWDSRKLEKRAYRIARQFKWSRKDQSELRRLTVRLEDFAEHAITVRKRIDTFLEDIGPDSSLWATEPTLEAQVFVIRSTDRTIEEYRDIQERIRELVRRSKAQGSGT